MKIKLLEELETDTNIEWWNDNRKRINRVIRHFNKWQTELGFDELEREIILAEIKTCRKYGEINTFSEWQFELLDEMEEFIKCSNG